jgi:hypothetical protein
MSIPSVRVWTALFVAGAALCLSVTFGATQVEASSNTSGSTGNALMANEVDVTGPQGLIVASLIDIYKTTDAGQQWTNITPPSASSDPVLLTHLMAIVSFGNRRIWLEFEGDSRFDSVPYSWNDGRTWSTSVLPDGLNNPTALQFTSANDGWATANVGSSQDQVTIRTVDGGRTWFPAATLTAPTPPVAAGQPPFGTTQGVPEGFTIVRTFRAGSVLSWAQASGPAIGMLTRTYLLRSTNSGRTWSTLSK